MNIRDCKGCIYFTKYYGNKSKQRERTVSNYWCAKKNPIITNAKKFEEVFGFLPDGDVIFSKDYFINAVKGPVLKWDEPYKEPEDDD